MDLAQVADELYGLSPAEFRAARDERVARARAAGDRRLAAAIGKLRRPTVSAWLVNQLAREAGDDLVRLAGLGEQLREAQRAFAGERLRELSAPRREQVSALVRRAKRLAAAAGQAVSAQHEREVAATLEAALADPEAAAAVRSGWLASPLSHVGLGEGGPGQALAIPVAAPPAAAPAKSLGKPARRLRAVPGTGTGDGRGKRAGKPRAARGAKLRAVPDAEAAAAAHEAARAAAAAQRRVKQVAEAERDLRDAEELAEQAGAALTGAEGRAVRARDRRHELRAEIERLERRLVEAQTEDATAGRELREAQRTRDAAARSLEAAQRRVLRAKAKLRDLSGPAAARGTGGARSPQARETIWVCSRRGAIAWRRCW